MKEKFKEMFDFVVELIIAVSIVYLLIANGIVRCGWEEPENKMSCIDGKFIYATQDYTVGIGKAEFILSRTYYYEDDIIEAAKMEYDKYEEHFVFVRKT